MKGGAPSILARRDERHNRHSTFPALLLPSPLC
jgi:hypothetical protein